MMQRGQYHITGTDGNKYTVDVVPIYSGKVCVACEINGKYRTLEQFNKLKPVKL